MPKGDRFKLKADPEDGTTPIANLLLEAVAMAKISGLQKGAILYLWRRTYGWADGDKRVKERKIALSEWLHALDSTKARVSTALSDLEGKNIIKRRTTDQWGGYYYSLNTNVASWNSDCINLTRLSEMITVADFGTVTQNGTVTEKGNSSRKRQQLLEATAPSPSPKKGGLPKTATVTQKRTEQLPKTEPPTLYKERIKKEIKKGHGEIKNVFLSKTELDKLTELFGEEGAKSRIESLSLYIGSKGTKYKSHYLTILNWERMNKERADETDRRSTSRSLARKYTKPEEL